MRRVLVLIVVIVVVAVGIYAWLNEERWIRVVGSAQPGYEVGCEQPVIPTNALCNLVARQLVADEVAAHPGREVYSVRITSDGILLCWKSPAAQATPAPSGDPLWGCTELTLEGGKPTPRP